MNEAVDEVIAVAAREGIDADIVKGGTLRVARTPAQATRLRHKVEQDHEWGVPESVLLTPAESARHIAIDGVTAGAYTPHCARLQPAALVRGLAETVERLGVTIYEKSPVTAIEPGRALTAHGTVRAPVVLRATEGFTASLKGLRRAWLPMNSSMIVTEPLPDDVWKDIGWEGRETLGDTAHGHMYAQRTPDDRIAIGGRGVAVPLRLPHRRLGPGQRPYDRPAHPDPPAHAAADHRCPRRPRLVRGPRRPPRLVGHRWRWTRPPVSAGPAATSATVSPPPTWPPAPSPTWC